MKKIITTALLLASVFATKQVDAQFGIGAGLDYNLIPAIGLGRPSLNVGGILQSNNNENMAYIGNFKYFFPYKKNIETKATALSSIATPQSVPAQVEEKLQLMTVSGGIRYYFKEGNVEDGGFFGSMSGGILLGKYKQSFSGFDNTQYTVTGIETDDDGSYSEFLFDGFVLLGIGYDYKVTDNLSVGGELLVSITTQGINSRTGSASPMPIIFSPGVNFRFFFN